MPHLIREQHLEEICSNCKKPHGNEITLLNHHHKVYEIIECQNCGYEIIRTREEKPFNERFEFM